MTQKMEGDVEKMGTLADGVERRGIQKGIIQGVEQHRRSVVENMLKENESTEKICRVVECDEAYVEMIKQELKISMVKSAN